MGALFGLTVLIVWPLIQIPLLLYLARRVDFEAEGEPDPNVYPIRPEATVAGGDGEARANRTGEATVCFRCGVENDPSYVYCSNCVARLDQGSPYPAPA